MDKVFALDGTYPALIKNLSVIERYRQAAIDAAFQGDFGFSIALFRKAFNAVPHMPRGWKSHKEILQEMRYAMEDSYQRSFEKIADSLYTNVVDIVTVAATGKPCAVVVTAVLDEHVRDFESATNTMTFLAYMRLLSDSMCSETGEIKDSRLEELENLLLRSDD